MKRCNYCFRFGTGRPEYCSRCGRSYDLRLCPLGHRNLRADRYCGTCGSAELSTPAPPSSVLSRLSLFVVVAAVVLFAALALAVTFVSIEKRESPLVFSVPMLRLAIVLALLYWTTTLLPGRIRRVRKPSTKHRNGREDG